jgi:2',3'-cyclic-nucleotide 2'-phosphodiesterase (5'-nucleotidase family)
MKWILRVGIILNVTWLLSCTGNKTLVQHQTGGIKIIADSLQLYDTATANFIMPYKNQLDVKMNEVIGVAEKTLYKSLPDGALGNMMADACMDAATKASGGQVDFCVLNIGGVRIPSIQQGNITLGKAYELMPFDNEIVVVELNGSQCNELFKWIVRWKGAPVAGIQMTLTDTSATDILIQGKQFDETQTYWVATSDYIANGGDKATMFAGGKLISTNIKLRDAIIDYIKFVQPVLKGDNNGRIK